MSSKDIKDLGIYSNVKVHIFLIELKNKQDGESDVK